MKQHWAAQELLDHWAVTPEEITLIQSASQTTYNRFGYGLLYKVFQRDGKFPQRKQDISPAIIEYIGRQLRLPEGALKFYSWTGRTAKRHRVHIRNLMGFRIGTVVDATKITSWLSSHALVRDDRQFDRLKEAVYDHFRELKIEPPPPGSVERIIRSAVRVADERLYTKVLKKLTPGIRVRLDALLDEDGQPGNSAPLSDLKGEAGAATLENIFQEIAKLRRIRALALPERLLAGITRKRLLMYKQRVAVEDLFEIRRHPPQVRFSLLAAFCTIRSEEITDALVELLIALIHKMGSRAKHIINKEVIREIKRVQGKNRLLYEVASASLDSPDGSVRNVIYPIAGEQTLHDLVTEYKQGGLYEERIRTVMRGSYSNHYRRMVPYILQTLTFCAANETAQPVIEALALIRKYADKTTAVYPKGEAIPLEGVVKQNQRELIQQGQKVNRINYELCVLETQREKLRWVVFQLC